MKTCRALISSRPNAGSRAPAPTRASIRAAVGVVEDALVDRERAHAVHDRERAGLLDVDLVRTDADRGHDGAEHAQVGRGEGLDQVSEPGQQRGLAAHELDQRRLRPRARMSARPATATASKKMAMFIAASASPRSTQALSCRMKPSSGLRPDRIADHHIARAGRKAEAVQRAREARRGSAARSATGTSRASRSALSWSVRTVCSPRPSIPSAAGSRPRGSSRAARPSRRAALNRRRLRSEVISAITSTFTPCRCSRSTWAWMSRAAAARSSMLAGAVDPAGDQLGVAGEQAEDVDILEEPDIVAVRADREAPLVVPRHQQQRVEDEVVEVDRDDVEAADFAHRGVERQAAQNDRLRQVHAGDDADALTIAHEERVDVVVPHAVAGLLDAGPSVDEYGGTIPYVAHARAQDAVHALRLPLPGEGVELAGYVRIEEGREGGVAADQARGRCGAGGDSRASPRPRRNPRPPPRARGRGSRSCPSARARSGPCCRPGPRRSP